MDFYDGCVHKSTPKYKDVPYDENCSICNPDDGLDASIYKDEKQRVVGKEGGLKNDLGKPRWSLVPLDIIEGIAVILTYGAKKYATNRRQGTR